MQMPNKQGDDGWKSVLYEGQPLELFRRKYSGKPRTPQPRRGSASAQDGDEVSDALKKSSHSLILHPLPLCLGRSEHVADMWVPHRLLRSLAGVWIEI